METTSDAAILLNSDGFIFSPSENVDGIPDPCESWGSNKDAFAGSGSGAFIPFHLVYEGMNLTPICIAIHIHIDQAEPRRGLIRMVSH